MGKIINNTETDDFKLFVEFVSTAKPEMVKALADKMRTTECSNPVWADLITFLDAKVETALNSGWRKQYEDERSPVIV